ncbi:hypothetical protein [Staphylococcus xylosus]|uniref:hypothetical protein n=1 Tax=Staphylococcus xylosus TaxID=1288 RepID=UPI0019517D77|nr:hypothetical protein [Staphylococcus xylosus]MBM6637479.1 hypothetical protein [Staphylococcus xylosus]
MTHLTLHEEIYKTRIEYQKIKAERDTLIDDIAVLKANISRLERENERLKERNYQLAKTNDGLYLDNYKLEQENEKQLDLLQDFSKFINYKLIVSPASDTYKHYRSELDKLGVK